MYITIPVQVTLAWNAANFLQRRFKTINFEIPDAVNSNSIMFPRTCTVLSFHFKFSPPYKFYRNILILPEFKQQSFNELSI